MSTSLLLLIKQAGLKICQRSVEVTDRCRGLKRTQVHGWNIPACGVDVKTNKKKSCTLHLQSSGSCLSLPFGATRVLNLLLQLLTKMADYWTKIKHLPTNLWTGSQTTESTAILRSLFSCLLLWFDWAGEPCLVPPNPQSLDPISHSIWMRRCGWQRQDASLYLLYPIHSWGCSP